MRIALVSDIHGNLPALEAIVDDIRRRGADRIVNLGDCLSGPLLPRETAQYLMEQDWLTLAGNHERQVLTQGPGRRAASDEYAHSQLTGAQFEWLRSLPQTADIAPDVHLCHGTPSSDLQYFLETIDSSGAVRMAGAKEVQSRLGSQTAAMVACGHTHIARSMRTRSGQLIVNPGSVGLQAYRDDHPPHAIENGTPDARYAIVERTTVGWAAALLSVPYDYKPMAQLARLRGRPDWEHALLTGYMP